MGDDMDTPIRSSAVAGGMRIEPTDIGRREAAKRRKILDVTWRLIAERGYHNTRVQDIAAACGTSTGTIHYYFPGKGAVLSAAMEFCVDEMSARQQTELSSIEDARERMIRVVEIQIQDEPGSGASSVWLQLWTLATLRPELRDMHGELYTRWEEEIRRVLRRGRRQGVFRSGDEEELLGTFLAVIDGLTLRVTTGVTTPETARALAVAWLRRELFSTPPSRRPKRTPQNPQPG